MVVVYTHLLSKSQLYVYHLQCTRTYILYTLHNVLHASCRRLSSNSSFQGLIKVPFDVIDVLDTD